MQRSLIIGIDPGTTLGYAILDLYGNLIKISSSKQIKLSSLIFEIKKYGLQAIIASDVTPPPKSIKGLAASFGAKLVYPKEKLRVEEKRDMVYTYLREAYGENWRNIIDFGDRHQLDALCAAIISFRRIRKLLKKINNSTKDYENNAVLFNKVAYLLLTGKCRNLAEAVLIAKK